MIRVSPFNPSLLAHGPFLSRPYTDSRQALPRTFTHTSHPRPCFPLLITYQQGDVQSLDSFLLCSVCVGCCAEAPLPLFPPLPKNGLRGKLFMVGLTQTRVRKGTLPTPLKCVCVCNSTESERARKTPLKTMGAKRARILGQEYKTIRYRHKG